MPLNFIITDAGQAAIANAQHDGTNAVRVASVGVSPTNFAFGHATTVLPGETKRIATIGGTAAAANILHLLVGDATADTFTVRSFALYLTTGVLFGVYSQADVIIEKSSAAGLLLALDIAIVDNTAALITFGDTNFVDPPATVDRAGVVELATTAETQTGTDGTRAVTPLGLAQAIAALIGDVWRPSNDGSGSGLDADLLDGRDSTYFLDILARLGFTPVNRAGDTMTGTLQVGTGAARARLTTAGDLDLGRGDGTAAIFLGTGGRYLYFDGSNYYLNGAPLYVNGGYVWTSNNDGAGSGLDADLLDGHDTSFFTDIVARLGYRPVNSNGDSIAGSLTVNAGNVSGRGLIISDDGDLVDLNDGYLAVRFSNGVRIYSTRSGGTVVAELRNDGAGFFTSAWINGNPVWHAGNDGAGSGLDADLLDGNDSSAFERIVASSYTDYGGYEVYASGKKRCWGYITLGGDQGGYFYYPISFSSWVIPGTAHQVHDYDTGQNQNVGIVGEPGLSYLRIYNAENWPMKIWIELFGV